MSGRWVLGAGCGVVALAAGQARATWSILLVDLRTSEIAVGSATCVTGIDLRENTPVIIAGVGAATAQAVVDQTGQNRVFVRDRLVEGVDPDGVLTLLEAFDAGHQGHQYGIVDAFGGAATFSGSSNAAWAGGFTGRIERGAPGPADDIVYAIQGNILTGEPVVQCAIDAVRDTDGDLADRLMAGMEAAAAWGGDGRCSCGDIPTACGSPPPGPFKSAHVGYMLIARVGDRDGCASVYRVAQGPSAVTGLEFDGAPGVDLAAAPFSGGSVELLPNSTTPGAVFVTLGAATGVSTGVDRLRGLASGDVTGDGVVDLVVSAQQPSSVVVLEGSVGAGGAVSFAARPAQAVASNPFALVVADLDGAHAPDVAVACQSGNALTVLLSDGAGGFAAPVAMAVTGGVRGVAPGDVDGDGDTDLVTCQTNSDTVVVWTNDGAGGFTAGAPIAVGDQPQGVHAGLLNADALPDFAVVNAGGRSVTVLTSGPGGLTPTTLPLGNSFGVDGAVDDLNGDGHADVVAIDSRGDVFVLEGDGAGGFVRRVASSSGQGSPWTLGLVDFAGDGAPDVVTGARSSTSLVVLSNRGGQVESGLGCASGSYYMELNTGARGTASPDAVELLRADFDAWEADQSGRPDAVRSLVSGRGTLIEGALGSFEVELRDREGGAVVGASVSAEVNDAAAGAVEGVADLGGGRFVVEVRAGSVVGARGEVVIRADDGTRSVVLTPAPRIAVSAAWVDLDGDGTASIEDVALFVAAWIADDPAADLNEDGVLNPDDVALFVQGFAGL